MNSKQPLFASLLNFVSETCIIKGVMCCLRSQPSFICAHDLFGPQENHVFITVTRIINHKQCHLDDLVLIGLVTFTSSSEKKHIIHGYKWNGCYAQGDDDFARDLLSCFMESVTSQRNNTESSKDTSCNSNSNSSVTGTAEVKEIKSGFYATRHSIVKDSHF